MFKHLLLPVVMMVSAPAAFAQVLIDPGFANSDQAITPITNSEVGSGWHSVSATGNTWTRDGITVLNRTYSTGEMGRVGGNQNDPVWFGQVVTGGSGTGTFTLDLDYRIANASASYFIEIYGATAATAPDFTLDNDTMGAGWTILNTTTSVAISGTNAAANDQISFDMGTGYDYLGVRIRSNGLGSNGAGPPAEELAFTNIAIVPEPSVSLLLMAGLGVVSLSLRRRRNV